jgi:hypothetical protein
MSDDVELLRRIYALFASRGRLGKMEWKVATSTDAMTRSYWKRQWATIDPHVPIGISLNGKGEVIVKVHQVVRDLKGNMGLVGDIENGLAFVHYGVPAKASRFYS